MIAHLFVILAFQLAGEVTTRALGLLLPGPVLGLVMMIVAFILFPKLAEAIRPTALGLLSHLSLLFVPAGVGVIGHLSTFGDQGVALLVALLISTPLAIAVGAVTFVGVARLTERADV